MSSDAPGDGGDRHGRRASIGNLVKRVKTVMRRKSSTAQATQAGESSSTAPITATAGPATVQESVSSSQPAEMGTQGGSPLNVGSQGEDSRQPGPSMRSTTRQERVQELFAKYDIAIDPDEVLSSRAQEYPDRIHRPIRMRVHRTCHRCKTTFGPDKTCVNCHHRKCTKCPRYPVKKPKKQVVDSGSGPAGKRSSPEPPSTAGALRTRKEDTNIHKSVQPAVSRFCHKCDTMFDPPNQSTCQGCGHNRCTRCLQQPKKAKRWPDAYARDASGEEENQPPQPDRVYRKPKARVKWFCEKCGDGFLAKSKICKCGHERCDTCKRMPPKKVRPSVDPDVLKAVEAKLAELDLNPLSAPTTVTVTVP
ncbi:MAG: hypothetical protein M1821_000429 [Bathelium mastoideum]|nr:MAG: hypothetical protein M1821_000429 [Bathelium mastoideum]